MECPDIRQLLAYRRPGELAAEERAALDGHLATCPDCAAAARRQDSFDAVVSRAMLSVAAPAGLRDRLLTNALARQGAAWRTRVYRTAAYAAALLIAVGLVGGGAAWLLRPAFDTTALADAYGRQYEDPERAVSDWLAGQGLPPALPVPFDYRLHHTHGQQVVAGRDVPYVEFLHLAGQGRLETARVYVVRRNQFRLDADALRPTVNSFCTVRVVRDDDRGLAYVILFTSPTLDPFLKPDAQQAWANRAYNTRDGRRHG
jgi:hypothetical protein